MKNRHKNIKNELAYFYKVIKNMVRGLALPVVDEANPTNRKKHRDLRMKISKATMFLTEI